MKKSLLLISSLLAAGTLGAWADVTYGGTVYTVTESSTATNQNDLAYIKLSDGTNTYGPDAWNTVKSYIASSSNLNTLQFTSSTITRDLGTDTTGTIGWTFDKLYLAGVIVDQGTNCSGIALSAAKNANRQIFIGATGTTAESTINDNFKIDNSLTGSDYDATIAIAGTQTWTVASTKTFTIQSNSTSSITQEGSLTIAGAGTVKLASTLESTGTISVSSGSTLDLSGISVSLTSAITNEGTVKFSSSTVFVLDGLDDSSGTYTVISDGSIDSTGTAWGDLTISNFMLNGVTLGRSTLDLDTAGSVSITAGTAQNLVWAGTSGTWDVDTTNTNWTNSTTSSADYFATGDSVTFDSTATANKTVTSAGTISVGNMTVSDNYTFTTGSSTVIEGSTLTIASGATMTLGVKEANAAISLDFENISLAGKITINTNTGVDLISWKKVTFEGGNINVYDAGTRISIGNTVVNTAGSIGGTWGCTFNLGAITGSGTLTLNQTSQSQGPMTYNADSIGAGTTVSVSSGATFNVTNILTNGTLSSAGTTTVSGTNSGALNITAGTTTLTGTNSGSIFIDANGTLAMSLATNSGKGLTFSNVTGTGTIQLTVATATNTPKPINLASCPNFTGTVVLVGGSFSGTTGATLYATGLATIYTSDIKTAVFGSAAKLAFENSVAIAEASNEISANLEFRSGSKIFIYPNSDATVEFKGTVDVKSGATVYLEHAKNTTFSNAVTLDGTMNVVSGTVTLSNTVSGSTDANTGAVSTTGKLNLTGGTLSIGAAANISTAFKATGGTLSVASGATVSALEVAGSITASGKLDSGVLNVTADSTITTATSTEFWVGRTGNTTTGVSKIGASITIADGVTLKKAGAGQLVLVNPTLSGGTLEVNAGDLFLGYQSGSGTIGTKIVVNSGGTFNLNYNDVKLKDFVLNSGGQLRHNGDSKTDSSKLTLSGDSTLAGTVQSRVDVVVASGTTTVSGTAIASKITVQDSATLKIVAGTETSGAVVFANGANFAIDLTGATVEEGVALEIITATSISDGLSAFSNTWWEENFDAANSVLAGYEDYIRTWAYDSGTLSLTLTIPEPSMFGLLAGTLALGLAGTRRRRSKK